MGLQRSGLQVGQGEFEFGVMVEPQIDYPQFHDHFLSKRKGADIHVHMYNVYNISVHIHTCIYKYV